MAHFCKNCGLLTAPYDERCPKCGAPLPHIPMGEALLESMRQSLEGTVETGEPLYEQDLEEDRIDAMSQGATTAAMLLFAIPIAGFVLAVVWSFGGTQDRPQAAGPGVPDPCAGRGGAGHPVCGCGRDGVYRRAAQPAGLLLLPVEEAP